MLIHSIRHTDKIEQNEIEIYKIVIRFETTMLPDRKLMPFTVADFGWNIYYIRAIWQRVD